MSSIFDGHENQSTEELADELGISDLSIIKNTEKEIKQTIEASNIDNWGLSQKEIENPENWTKDIVLGNLKEGSRIKLIGTSTIGKVLNIKGNIISFRINEGKEDLPFTSFQTNCEVYKSDYKQTTEDNESEKNGKWVAIRKIEIVRVGMKIKNQVSSGIVKGIDINKEYIYIKRDSGMEGTITMDGMPPILPTVFIKDSEFKKQNKRTKKFSFEELKVNLTVTNGRNDGYIESIDEKYIKVIRDDDNRTIYSNKEVQNEIKNFLIEGSK